MKEKSDLLLAVILFSLNLISSELLLYGLYIASIQHSHLKKEVSCLLLSFTFTLSASTSCQSSFAKYEFCWPGAISHFTFRFSKALFFVFFSIASRLQGFVCLLVDTFTQKLPSETLEFYFQLVQRKNPLNFKVVLHHINKTAKQPNWPKQRVLSPCVQLFNNERTFLPSKRRSIAVLICYPAHHWGITGYLCTAGMLLEHLMR